MRQRSEVRGQRSALAGRLRRPGRSIARHRGFALVEVIIGGVLLAVGLAVVISIATRSLANQTNGEKQMTASWLVDDLLNMVVVEGPVEFGRQNDTTGRCDSPFEEFQYELDIDDQGVGEPYRVTATIRWPGGRGWREVSAQTLIAERGGDPADPNLEARAPMEPLDREERYYEDEEE